jgi:hypothetical protein
MERCKCEIGLPAEIRNKKLGMPCWKLEAGSWEMRSFIKKGLHVRRPTNPKTRMNGVTGCLPDGSAFPVFSGIDTGQCP